MAGAPPTGYKRRSGKPDRKTDMKHIPNILTGCRLLGGVLMFLFLAAAAGGVPFISASLTPDAQFALERWALIAFVLACATDFFDGWLARKLHAESVWGAILDPIGDKILIAGAIMGLAALGPQPQIAVPFAVILFREFAVSGLREGVAPKGVKIPVSFLAKCKTALQMVAIFAELLVGTWAAWGLSSEPDVLGTASNVANVLLWLAAIVTVWTGAGVLAQGPRGRRRRLRGLDGGTEGQARLHRQGQARSVRASGRGILDETLGRDPRPAHRRPPQGRPADQGHRRGTEQEAVRVMTPPPPASASASRAGG